MKYDVFVSYRHVRPDADVARAVARLVEGYVVAGSVGGVVKRRGFRVFRDVEELASGELGVLIESALAESEFLVVVCSPRTAGSVWCMREVEFFSRVRGVDHVLAVVVEGDPGVVVGDVVGGDVLAVDVRAGAVRSEGFGGFEGCGSGVVDRLVRQSVGVLRRDGIDRLMAGVVGVSLGDLRQRQRERRMRRITAATAAATLVTGLFAATSAGLWIKARRDSDVANRRSVETLMDLADATIAGGDRELGLLYSNLAWSRAKQSWDSYAALRGRHYVNVTGATSRDPLAPLTRIKTDSGVASFGIGSNRTIVTAGKSANLSVWSSENGKRLRSVTLSEKPIDVGASVDGTRFYGIDSRGRLTVTPADGGPARTVRIADARAILGTVLAGDRLFVVHNPLRGNSHIRGYDVKTGTQIFDVDFSNRPFVHFDNAPDGSEFAVAFKGGGAERYDGATGALRQSIVDPAQDGAALANSNAEGGTVNYSMSGNKLLYRSVPAMHVVSLPSGSVVSNAVGKSYRRGIAKISRDGTFVIDPVVGKKVNAATGKELSSYALTRGDDRSLVWLSPRDDAFIIATAGRELMLWDDLSDTKPFDPSITPTSKRAYSGPPVEHGQFTHDGKRFVTVGSDGNLTVYDVAGTDKGVKADGSVVTRSNNRDFFYSYSKTKGVIVDARRIEGKATPTEVQSSSRSAVSNDGKAMAFSSQAYTEGVTVVSESGAVKYRTPEDLPRDPTGTSIVFGPSHDIVYVTAKGEIVHYDSSGKLGSYGSQKDGDVASLLASADGSVLLVNREGGKWQAYNVKTRKLLKRGTGTVYAVSGKDGAFESATLQAGNSISTVDASGNVKRKVEAPREIARHIRSGQVLDANQDKFLIRVQKQVVVFDLAVGQVVQRFRTPVVNAQALLVSDGVAYDASDALFGSFRLVKNVKLADAEAAAKKMVGDRKLTESEKEVIGQ